MFCKENRKFWYHVKMYIFSNQHFLIRKLVIHLQ